MASIEEAQAPSVYAYSPRYILPAGLGQNVVWQPLNSMEFRQSTVTSNPPVNFDMPTSTYLLREVKLHEGENFAIGTSPSPVNNYTSWPAEPQLFECEDSVVMMLKYVKDHPIHVNPGDFVCVSYLLHPMKKANDVVFQLPYLHYKPGYFGLSLEDKMTHFYLKIDYTGCGTEPDLVIRKVLMFQTAEPKYGFSAATKTIASTSVTHAQLASILLGLDPSMSIDANPLKAIKRTFTTSRSKIKEQEARYAEKYKTSVEKNHLVLASQQVTDAQKSFALGFYKGADIDNELKSRRAARDMLRKHLDSFSSNCVEYEGWMKKLISKMKNSKLPEDKQLASETAQKLKTFKVEERTEKNSLINAMTPINGAIDKLLASKQQGVEQAIVDAEKRSKTEPPKLPSRENREAVVKAVKDPKDMSIKTCPSCTQSDDSDEY
jgi:hypothetical protein